MGFIIPFVALINMCTNCNSPYPRARFWAKGSAIQFLVYVLLAVIIVVVVIQTGGA